MNAHHTAEAARDDRDGSGTERDMAAADEANGEGSSANDTEARYGEDESPA